MHVICAGMRRSGSTWQHNAVRLICQRHGDTVAWFGQDANRPALPPAIHEIRKTHKFHWGWAREADLVLTCHRDPRDVAASAMRRGLHKREKSLTDWLARAICHEHAQWACVAAWDMSYEQMFRDPRGCLEMIAGLLGMPCDTGRIHAELDSMMPPDKGIDPITQMNAGHLTCGVPGSYRSTLTGEQAAEIERLFGPWMRHYGYAGREPETRP